MIQRFNFGCRALEFDLNLAGGGLYDFGFRCLGVSIQSYLSVDSSPLPLMHSL